MSAAEKTWRLGIDVGGTNTDAVVVDEQARVIASTKHPTTPDVSTGIERAIATVLASPAVDKSRIGYAMLGTTHCTNAIVERKRLKKVAILRLAYPATLAIEPMLDWPDDLREQVEAFTVIAHGGLEFDGRVISELDEDEIRAFAQRVLDEGVEAVAVVGVFSPISARQEERARDIILEVTQGRVEVTLSSEIGSLGLLERENASILNAALADVAQTITTGFAQALEREGLEDLAVYIGQNDGTLMSIDYARTYPILTIASGPTNSIRGAAFRTGLSDAIVVDIGGTTTDIGVLANGFPRESLVAVEIGGARTNFRMPDILSLGLGGGSIVREHEDGTVTVGPDSVGYLITERAQCFGGDTLTATDIAVASGRVALGDPAKVQVSPDVLAKAQARIAEIIERGVDSMKTASGDADVILVGGGAIIAPEQVAGARELIYPEDFGVVNALGSAIGQVSGQVEKVYSLKDISREAAVQDAQDEAVRAARKSGAAPDTISIVNVEQLPLPYIDDALRVKVKAVGGLDVAR